MEATDPLNSMNQPAEDETNPHRLYEVACQLMYHEEYASAIDYINRSIQYGRGEATPIQFRNIALCYFHLREFDQAEHYYELARDGFVRFPRNPHTQDYVESRLRDCNDKLKEIKKIRTKSHHLINYASEI